MQPQTQSEIRQHLTTLAQELSAHLRRLSPEQFNHGSAESWSPAGYLKHLILSVKPVVKAMNLKAERMEAMFGVAATPSRPYDELVATYQARLAEGIRAEDYENVTPGFYRFPEGVSDEQAYLIQTWDESNERLVNALDDYSESDLDRLQLPHPAVGMVTLREMLFFTLFHNRLHAGDIQRAAPLK